MSDAELAAHRLLIVPGGDFMVIGKNLKGTTAAKIRSAVQDGLGYLGICGGALMAADSPDYNGFNLTGGVRFGFYADVNRGIHKDAVAIARPGEPPIDQYWEDGPALSGWGDVVAKYPDGTPAIAEGAVGRGWAILSGVHPEAPESWRRGMTFATLGRRRPRLRRDADLGGAPAHRAAALLTTAPRTGETFQSESKPPAAGKVLLRLRCVELQDGRPVALTRGPPVTLVARKREGRTIHVDGTV